MKHTFRHDDVKLDDVEVLECAHDVAVRLRVLLRGVRGGESARREEGVAWCAKVRDGGCALVVRRRVRDLVASPNPGEYPSCLPLPVLRASMYSRTTLTFASSCDVRLGGEVLDGLGDAEALLCLLCG